jgi:hypothetical protein
MKTIFRFTRFVFALVLALSAIGMSTSAALAGKPTKTEFAFTASSVLTDVCSFPIVVDSTISGTEIDFFDESGALTRIYNHIVEQDTFTANGKTLVGIPFTFNIQVLFDSSGNVTHIYAGGLVEKIPLPDGSLFVSAGRLDFTAHPGATFLLSPDKGNPGNIAGFCAALSP